MSNFEIQLYKYSELIKTRVTELFPKKDTDVDAVREAFLYSFLNGGKRIRPALLLEFYKICGGQESGAVDFAVALEMIHTYSLIHDDLPCMDNDDFRRGKPSCHKAFGEDIAVLAGDALLTEAFRIAANASGILPEIKIKAIAMLSEYAGIYGMIGGQIMDIAENNSNNLDYIKKIYSLKTGALLECACTVGCVLANRSDLCNFAKEYAMNLGLAFQIQDDILDKIGNAESLGKPIHSDEANKKITYVDLRGINDSKIDVDLLTLNAKNAIANFPGNCSFLTDISDYLAKRTF